MPRPAFRLRLPLRCERPEEGVKLVTLPITLQHSPMAGMGGVLLSQEDIPIANARVALTALGLATHTDAMGRFWFSAVPDRPALKCFRVQARGREFAVEVERKTEDQSPLIIRINPGES